MGPGYANDIFYSMNKEQKNTNWDIAFARNLREVFKKPQLLDSVRGSRTED